MLDALQCRECGAPPRGMKLCHDLFDDLLGTKYMHSGEPYRLSIACYTFQHPQSHSAKAWHFARRYLEALVHGGLPSIEARDAASHADAQDEPPAPPAFPKEIWEMSIVDFTERLMLDPMQAAIDWAHSIVECAERYQENAP